MAKWTEPRPEHSGMYAYVEQLPNDAPPVKLRSYRPIRINYVGWVLDTTVPVVWEYWTVAGWATLTSRVCICERPEE